MESNMTTMVANPAVAYSMTSYKDVRQTCPLSSSSPHILIEKNININS